MKKNVTKITFGILTLLLILGLGFWLTSELKRSKSTTTNVVSVKRNLKDLPALSDLGKVESKIARNEYFFRLLRDPETNTIPRNIRARELNHAKQISTFKEIKLRKKGKKSTNIIQEFNWQLAGPQTVGGRTRALAIDIDDPNTMIAGGVSGGIWKSTDGGNSWELKTPDAENFSVTSLAQDPTNLDTWYYTSGEFTADTPGAPSASYYGTGIFRSTNNGESWQRINATADDNTRFDSQFDFVNRIVVNPSTGTVFIASNGFGIFRSTDGTNFNDLTLGGPGEHAYADIAVSSDGSRIVAVTSSADASPPDQPVSNNPGIFVSEDDGQSWNEITPSSFPSDYFRSVITFAPSNPDIIYVFTLKDTGVDNTNQGVSFYKLDLSQNPLNAQDRASNLPDFGDPVGGVNTQGGYNMVVSVKPDDPNFVFVGATNLFRSTDGFATGPSGNTTSEKDEFWIGGYAKPNTSAAQYESHHVDQHVIVYDPTDPNRVWTGNDGGVYVTDDVTASSVSWNDQNASYVVTQFYDASIPPSGDDDRLMGGTQDNGTPFFEFDGQQNGSTASTDISSGDGGYSFFTEALIYVSNQQSQVSGNNRVIRFNSDFSGTFAIVQPSQASTSFFINPYTIDPNDEGIMYYPGGSSLFRNTQVDDITDQDNSGTTQGWDEVISASLEDVQDITYDISALAVSSSNPENVLYYAGSNSNESPVIRRLDNASTSSEEPTVIDIPDAPQGAFVHDIAINPINGDEVLVVMSNYNIVGLYHTTNGGNTWEAVEGNLTGVNDPTSPNPGPSLRSATIIPSDTGPIYVLGTSTGLYATQDLNGDNTEWGRESESDTDGIPDIGYSVIENITSRQSNGDIAVGTHGRGMFLGSFQGSTSFPFITATPSQARTGETITLTANNFDFGSSPADNTVLFRAGDIVSSAFCQTITVESVPGEVVSATASSIEVNIPRGVLPDECAASNLVNLSVNVQDQSPDPSPTSFSILPPNDFTLQQNYPNPFNPATTIPIDLAVDSRVTLAIYDMLGQKVMEPVFEDEFIAGTFNTRIDLSNLASGVYIYRVVARPLSGNGETFVESRKMTLIK